MIGIITIFLPSPNYVSAPLWFRGKTVENPRENTETCHTHVVGHFITMVSTFSAAGWDVTRDFAAQPNPHLSQERAGDAENSPQGKQETPMTFGPNEAAIDEIVASCNGDLRGALKALLLVNEHLEAEIAQLYAAAAQYGITERGNNVLH
jgi:hypothetical protein